MRTCIKVYLVVLVVALCACNTEPRRAPRFSDEEFRESLRQELCIDEQVSKGFSEVEALGLCESKR